MAKPKLGSGKRFANFVSQLKKEGYSEKSASAIAAAAGRKKYGNKRMSALAAAGRRRK